uniref:Uncharacterized protein n=1 Tax=Anguilla anguilla TaxID=7936 RepID=A0A0E9PLE4_ANGAN
MQAFGHMIGVQGVMELVGGSANQVIGHVSHKLSHPVSTGRSGQRGGMRNLQKDPGNTAVGKLMGCNHKNHFPIISKPGFSTGGWLKIWPDFLYNNYT